MIVHISRDGVDHAKKIDGVKKIDGKSMGSDSIDPEIRGLRLKIAGADYAKLCGSLVRNKQRRTHTKELTQLARQRRADLSFAGQDS